MSLKCPVASIPGTSLLSDPLVRGIRPCRSVTNLVRASRLSFATRYHWERPLLIVSVAARDGVGATWCRKGRGSTQSESRCGLEMTKPATTRLPRKRKIELASTSGWFPGIPMKPFRVSSMWSRWKCRDVYMHLIDITIWDKGAGFSQVSQWLTSEWVRRGDVVMYMQLRWDKGAWPRRLQHQQNKTYLIPLITSYSLLKPLILGVRRGLVRIRWNFFFW